MIKSKKYKGYDWFYNYYIDSKTGITILHGLYNSWYDIGVGYYYHTEEKGFWLK